MIILYDADVEDGAQKPAPASTSEDTSQHLPAIPRVSCSSFESTTTVFERPGAEAAIDELLPDLPVPISARARKNPEQIHRTLRVGFALGGILLFAGLLMFASHVITRLYWRGRGTEWMPAWLLEPSEAIPSNLQPSRPSFCSFFDRTDISFVSQLSSKPFPKSARSGESITFALRESSSNGTVNLIYDQHLYEEIIIYMQLKTDSSQDNAQISICRLSADEGKHGVDIIAASHSMNPADLDLNITIVFPHMLSHEPSRIMLAKETASKYKLHSELLGECYEVEEVDL